MTRLALVCNLFTLCLMVTVCYFACRNMNWLYVIILCIVYCQSALCIVYHSVLYSLCDIVRPPHCMQETMMAGAPLAQIPIGGVPHYSCFAAAAGLNIVNSVNIIINIVNIVIVGIVTKEHYVCKQHVLKTADTDIQVCG